MSSEKKAKDPSVDYARVIDLLRKEKPPVFAVSFSSKAAVLLGIPRSRIRAALSKLASEGKIAQAITIFLAD